MSIKWVEKDFKMGKQNSLKRLLLITLFYSLIIAILVGVIRTVSFIQQDNYLPYNLSRVIYYHFRYLINYYLVITIAVCGTIALSIHFIKKLKKYVFPGLVSLALLGAGGYYLNRQVLPGIYEIESIVGNSVFGIICLLIGFLVYHFFDVNFDFISKLYNRYVLIGSIIGLLIFEIIAYYNSDNNRFISASKKISDEEFIDLFNLDRSGLEAVKARAKKGDYSSAKKELLKYYKNRPENSWRLTEEKINQPDSSNVVEAAEKALKHIFILHGESVAMGESFKWNSFPNAHREQLWSLNRHEWFQSLGKAYRRTGDEKYAIEFNHQISDWIQNCPKIKWKSEKHPCWYLLAAATRMDESWCQAFQLFRHSPNFTDDTRMSMLSSIHDHAQFLKLFKSPSQNHLLFESFGLAVASIYFPEFKLANEWKQVAFERIKYLFETEINSDGSYWELATGYHCRCTRFFEHALEVAEAGAVELDLECYRNKLIKMYQFMMYILRPDGVLPCINDGATTNIRHLLLDVGKRYNRSDLIYVGSGYQHGQKPEHTSQAFPDAGYYVMRSDWNENARFLLFDAGPFGSGHGHEDKLSFELAAYGETFLVDPGTYTYNVKDNYRWYFSLTSAHNTIVVDHQRQARFWDKSRWVYQDDYQNENRWQSTDDFDFVVGEYADGYGNKKENVDRSIRHIRKILFVKPEYWVIADYLVGDGEHQYQQYFNFMPMNVELKDDKSVITKNEHAANLLILPLNVDDLAVEKYEGSENPIQGWYTEKFHEKTPAPSVVYSKKGLAPTSFFTVLYPFPPDQNADAALDCIEVRHQDHPLSPHEAVCLRLEKENRIDYIMISNDKPGIKKFENFETNAEIAFLRKDSEGRVVKQFVVGGDLLR